MKRNAGAQLKKSPLMNSPLQKTRQRTTQLKVSAELKRTLRDLEKSLAAWDCAKDHAHGKKKDQHLARSKQKSAEKTFRESELSVRTHLLFLMLKEQIEELSSSHSHPAI